MSHSRARTRVVVVVDREVGGRGGKTIIYCEKTPVVCDKAIPSQEKILPSKTDGLGHMSGELDPVSSIAARDPPYPSASRHLVSYFL